MTHILDGRKVRGEVVKTLRSKIKTLEDKPTLAIFQVGDKADSTAYIKQKKIFANEIGARVIHRHYSESVTQTELLRDIAKDNKNKEIHGILIQTPLPKHLEKDELIQAVDSKKDVDGLKGGFIPATARGIMTMCDYYDIQIQGKKVTVIGKSALVGKPVAAAFLNRGAIVTVCDKQTGDLVPHTKRADIIVVAAGQPKLIGAKHVSPGQIIIDVGISQTKRKIVGDVNFKDVEPIVAAISPVPGGVGPMTVASLFENLLEAYQKKG
jgi:methylenetetrahydrofolate dehydrogenase (NADP+)/methenyltetrahydrofolate cyclohydrolase